MPARWTTSNSNLETGMRKRASSPVLSAQRRINFKESWSARIVSRGISTYGRKRSMDHTMATHSRCEVSYMHSAR